MKPCHKNVQFVSTETAAWDRFVDQEVWALAKWNRDRSQDDNWPTAPGWRGPVEPPPAPYPETLRATRQSDTDVVEVIMGERTVAAFTFRLKAWEGMGQGQASLRAAYHHLFYAPTEGVWSSSTPLYGGLSVLCACDYRAMRLRMAPLREELLRRVMCPSNVGHLEALQLLS